MTYFDVLLNSITVNGAQVVEPGSGQVTRAASLCLIHTLSRVDPTSEVVIALRHCYISSIPHHANFEGPLCYHMIYVIQILLVIKGWGHPPVWMDYKPHPQEHGLFANTLVQITHKAREHQKKVPCWILRFVLHTLSLDPPPSTSVIADCLSIISMDLGCGIPSTRTTILDERYIYTS